MVTIRNNLIDSIHEEINKLRVQHTLEDWLKNLLDETFNALAQKLNRETEDVLQGLQDTLTDIQVDLGKGKVHREAIREKLNGYHQELVDIAKVIAPVKARLDETLSRAV